MKILIFCAGAWGTALKTYIEEKTEDTIVGFVDNNIEQGNIDGYIVYRPSDINRIDFDKIIIAISRKRALKDIKKQLSDLEIPQGKIIGMLEDKELFVNVRVQRKNVYDEMTDSRVVWLRNYADYVKEEAIAGNVAECGVFEGDFAVYINKYFSEKKLYLFDTFEGFADVDLQTERELSEEAFILSEFNKEADFSINNEEIAHRKMPYIERCEFRKGYFPDSTAGMGDDRFCFVNLDMDLYKPMLAGLEFFYDKMSRGGIILLHDYFHPELPGVKKAVQDYEEKYSIHLAKMPIGDGCSIAIIKL